MSDLDRYYAGRDRHGPRLSRDPALFADELAWTFGGIGPAARFLEEVLEHYSELVR